MKKVKRVPRKIGQDEDEEGSSGDASTTEIASAVRRPTNNKPKQSSTLRKTIALDGDDDEDNDATPVAKKPGLGRQAVERTAQLKSLPTDRIPLRASSTDSRPTYNADYLAELKSSTPTTPQTLSSTNDPDFLDEPSSKALDIAAKFGEKSLTTLDQQSAIPTDAEIQEKKERRRRLAQEKDFISLEEGNDAASDSDDDNDPGSRSLIIPAEELSLKDKYGIAESRLEHEDEDIAEGFDSFVEDPGQVTLGKKSAREQEKQRRADIEAQIRSAQPSVGDGMGIDEEADDVDEEEAVRLAAYEVAQTKFGTYGSRSTGTKSRGKEREESLHRRLQDLPKISPLPEWKSVIARFQLMIEEKEQDVQRIEQILANNRNEGEEISQEEERIQGLLREAGQRLEEAQKTAEEDAANATREGGVNGDGSSSLDQGRGLESFAGLAARPQLEAPNEATESSESEDEARPAVNPMFQGMVGVNPGFGTMSGMAQMPQDDDDY